MYWWRSSARTTLEHRYDEKLVVTQGLFVRDLNLKNVLQFRLSYIRILSQFHVLDLIFFPTGHFTRPILSLY